MKESLTYGVPAGLFSGALYFIILELELDSGWHIARNILVMFVLVFATLKATQLRNKAYFPFKFAWFTSFNVSFIASIMSSLLVVFIAIDILKEADHRVAIYLGFMEFISMLFFGIVISTILSAALKKNNHGTRS